MEPSKHRILPRTMRGVLVLLVSAAVVPLLLVLAGTYFAWYQTRVATEKEEDLQLARTVAMTFLECIHDINRQELTLGTALVSLSPYQPEQANRLLAQNAAEYPYIRFFMWVGPDGHIIASGEKTTLEVDISDRPYFQEIAAGNATAVSDLLRSRGQNLLSVMVARSIRDDKQTLRGVVVAAVDPDKLSNLTMNLNRTRGGMVSLFDRRGILVHCHPHVELDTVARNFKGRDPLLVGALAGEDRIGKTTRPDGVYGLVARVPIPEIGWAAGASRPVGVVRAPIRKTLYLAVAIVAAVTFVSIASASTISRRITRNLHLLRDHAVKIGQGDLDHRSDVHGLAEMEELAADFNRMAGQLKERSDALEQAALDLRRSNSDLEQFAYVASHDLQEPLRIVAGYLQLLERRYREHLDDTAHEFIQYAVDGAQRMKVLINDLLSYSRVGTQSKPWQPTDCQLVLDQALAYLSETIEAKGAVVTHDPLPTVLADQTQYVQLFQNLIGNALKFSRPDRRPEIHIGARRNSSEWVFSVRDNGIGIEAKYSRQIFEIFKRLHSQDEYGGTGIGLALCKKIVERHKGRIWVESQAGEGSTFYFTHPAEEV